MYICSELAIRVVLGDGAGGGEGGGIGEGGINWSYGMDGLKRNGVTSTEW